MAAHTTSDDASRYRPSEEEQEWAEKDPILRLRRHLEQLDEIDEDFIARCDEEGHDLAMQLHHHIHGMEEPDRSEEHTSELQSRGHLVCRLLLAKKKEPRDSAVGIAPSGDSTQY